MYFTWRLLLVVSPLTENKMAAVGDWPIERLPELLRYMGVVPKGALLRARARVRRLGLALMD